MKHLIFGMVIGTSALWGDGNMPEGCSNAVLDGDYGFSVSGTRPSGPPPSNLEEIVGVAMTRFDGKGGLTQTDNIHGSINGFLAPDRPGTGTYSINADCTGTMTLTVPGQPTLSLRIVVVDDGKEVRTAVMTPAAAMVTSNGRRVSSAVTPTTAPSDSSH